MKQTVYLLLKNLDQFRNLNIDFVFSVETFGWYLFSLIVLLKTHLNSSSIFPLSWVNKVTIGIKSFVSVIANVVAFFSLDSTNFSDQVKIRLISQLI